jgi:hypothetical protein
MANYGFGDMAHRFDTLASEMSGEALKKRLGRVGMAVKPDILAAVKAEGSWTDAGGRARTLADGGMTGFGNKEIIGRYSVTGSELSMHPQGSSVGQMAILQRGRKAYAAGDMRQKGTYTSKKTGLKTARTRKVKRNVSAHGSDKNTWGDAVEIMQPHLIREYEHQLRADMARFIRGV